MGISLKVTIFLMTASLSLISMKEHDGSGDHQTDEQHPEKAGMIGGVVGCLSLLVTVAVVLILFRHKLPWIQVCCAAEGSSEQRAEHNAEGNNGDPHYEEIQVGNKQTSAFPSISATVNSPADQLHYASVNFQKDSVGVSTDGKAPPDTTKNGSSTCEYSSIGSTQVASHPPAAGQPLYSTFTKPGGP